MASITVHSSPPSSLVAGGVYHWRTTPDNIADVDSYVVYFRSVEDSDVSFSVTGSDETTYFEFQLSGATTSALDAGEFTVAKVITYTWGAETDPAGSMVLLDNPANAPGKSYNQRMVELLESHLEGRLPEGLESHTVGGVPISKIPLTEAEALLTRYQHKVRAERNARRVRENPGLGSGNTVHIEF